MNLPFQLDRHSAVPLQDQLFEQLRQLILTGRLKPNTRIIATRFLAEQAGVSRTTVLLAYERLIAEGYLETRPAVGTFVSSIPPKQSKPKANGRSVSEIDRQALLHPAALQLATEEPPCIPADVIDFGQSHRHGNYLLPPKVWLEGMRRVFAQTPDGLAQDLPAAGVERLRAAIADYLAATRGITVSADQVIIVNGRRQACGFVAHLLQRRGDRVVMEMPGDEAIAGFFKARDADIVRVPADEDGLGTAQLPEGRVSLAYVTPACQNPLGGTMSHSRRMTLIEWARQSGAYLIEDESDGEFRYHGAPPLPLAALDPYGLVFYMGSFAKTLGEGVGLGYLVAPAEFVKSILAIKEMAEDGRPWLGQMVVANFLATGTYEHHLRRLRKIYMERRDCLIDALRSRFGDVRLIGTEIGTALTWVLPDGFPPAQVLCNAAVRHGVNVKPVLDGAAPAVARSRYHDRAMILGYGALTTMQLRQGVVRLAAAIADSGCTASEDVCARPDSIPLESAGEKGRCGSELHPRRILPQPSYQ